MSEHVPTPPAHAGGTGVSGTLGKRVGPLPLAGWLAAVIGGLGIAWYMRRSGQSSDAVDPALVPPTGLGGAGVSDPYGPATDDPYNPDATDPGTTTPAPGTTAGGPQGGGTISNDGSYSLGPAYSPSGTGVVTMTNTEWGGHAIWWIRTHGNYGAGVSAAAATLAVDQYLAGRWLTAIQASQIHEVIRGYRPPPHLLPIHVLSS